MSYLVFSTRIAKFLAKKNNLHKEQEEVLAYAIEVLGLNLLNISLIILIGSALGVLPGSVICLLTVAAIRVFAGGAHSDSPWRCAAVTALIFPVMALMASKTVILLRPFVIETILAASFFIGLIAILKLAPVDTPNAPIVSPARRKRLKNYALASLIVIGVAAVYIGYSFTNSHEFKLCIAFGFLWCSFILTSQGHKLFQVIDMLGISKKKEVFNNGKNSL